MGVGWRRSRWGKARQRDCCWWLRVASETKSGNRPSERAGSLYQSRVNARCTLAPRDTVKHNHLHRSCTGDFYPFFYFIFNDFYVGGAPGEIRTPDLLVRSQALYPTELRARKGREYDHTNERAPFQCSLPRTGLPRRAISAPRGYNRMAERERGIDSGLWPSPYGRRVRVVQNRLLRFCRTPFLISRVRILASWLWPLAERKPLEFTFPMAEREGFEPSMGF